MPIAAEGKTNCSPNLLDRKNFMFMIWLIIRSNRNLPCLPCLSYIQNVVVPYSAIYQSKSYWTSILSMFCKSFLLHLWTMEMFLRRGSISSISFIWQWKSENKMRTQWKDGDKVCANMDHRLTWDFYSEEFFYWYAMNDIHYSLT